MFKQIFLLDLVLIFCVLALASAQSARFVEAKYRSFNSSNLNTSGVLCAAQDGNKSFSWPSKYGLTAFCGPVGPVGKAACGKCLDVSYDNPSPKIFLTELVERVRIVDNCSSGGLELDIDVFKRFDTSGYGMSQGYLVVDYEFVDCGSSHSNWKGNLIIDFGLAKLCPKKESIISMTDQRGTMGYVAPEVWNRHFGGVSHKSDVYSYGMMLLEMVGGRKNIIADASHTSEIYFPHWVYNRLELGTNLRPDGVMDTEEDEIARRMTIVGLWCIQTFPSDRPTMSKVIEMLEVNMNLLEIPPKPYLSSPTRSISESFKS
ncbi:Chitinase / Hevein / PR-4 / Wheatwin2 [Medicago truncatula]|uniref:Chitinase / Hevein / PR-4 / Wheatwin2 n=1 Tax=Medicago truncatula TaxID=3880 RepID=A0A072UBN1_MEDTR|nr:Chitinase / Hevein / PR-4 / Wheatwin2 [Medicago truncatula]